jgi:hypothetical protein
MKIFICYKHENKIKDTWVEKLVSDIRNKYHFDCLFDMFDTAERVPAFSRRIEECNVLLAVMTAASRQALEMGSGYFSYEIDIALSLAMQNRLLLIPVLREADSMTAGLHPYPWVDFCDNAAYESNLLRLLSRIQTCQSRQPAPPQPATQERRLYTVEAAISDSAITPSVAIGFVQDLWEQATTGPNIETLAQSLLQYYQSTLISKKLATTIVLENLYSVFAVRHKLKMLDTEFDKLSRIRAGVFVRILLLRQDIDDATCARLVSAATENMAVDGFADYLHLVNEMMPCRNQDRLYWAAILAWALCGSDLPADLPEEYNLLRQLKLDKITPEAQEGDAQIRQGLASGEAMVRIHAMFRLIVWAAGLHDEPLEAAFDYDGLQKAVAHMLRAEGLPEKLIALIALRFFVQKPKGLFDVRRLKPQHNIALMGLLTQPANEPILNEVIIILGAIFQTRYDYRDVRNWLPGAANSVPFNISAGRYAVAPPAGLAEALLDIAHGESPFTVNEERRRIISLALLRLGICDTLMLPHLLAMLNDVNETPKIKKEILVRLTQNRCNISVVLLQAVAASQAHNDDLRLLALAGLLQAGHGEVLTQLKATLPGLEANEVKVLLAESQQAAATGQWTGPVAAQLYNRFINFELRNSGHLIHKLKAKDTTGRWAYYFVFVEPEQEKDFIAAIEGDGTIDLEHFGKVVASCYGESPTEEVKNYLKEKYGFSV